MNSWKECLLRCASFVHSGQTILILVGTILNFFFFRPDYSILLWLSKGTFANWTNLLRIKPKLSCKKKKIKSELSPIVPQKISAQSSRISLRYRPRTSLELLSLGDHLTTRYVHFIWNLCILKYVLTTIDWKKFGLYHKLHFAVMKI